LSRKTGKRWLDSTNRSWAVSRSRPSTAINRPGLAHLAFAVDDVEMAREAVLAAGGGEIGEVVSLDVRGAGTVTFAYLTDPEGNVVELQRWL
jgi:catechol 2,3-dioxygenase-like lactoylglutathione lyase family enzyme